MSSYFMQSMDIHSYEDLDYQHLEELHEYYNTETKKTAEKADQNIFYWNEFPVTIYFIEDVSTGFAFAAYVDGQEKDSFKYFDFTKETDTLDYKTRTTGKKKIQYLQNQGLLVLDENEKVLEQSIAAMFLTAQNFIDQWIIGEYYKVNKELSKEAKDLVYIDSSTIHQSKFQFREMLTNINDEQFKAEFSEFLFGYNNKQFFLAASAMGSIIEHLMFLILDNYDEAKLLGNRRPTAKNYLSAFEKSKYIQFNDRDSSYFDNIFQTRNSFSHFNTGYALKSQCDMMLLGLTSLYKRFYLPSKVYQAKKK